MAVLGLPIWLSDKESTCQCRRCRRCVFNPGVRKIPWSRKWQPTTLFLPGKVHGQRSLVGYSSRGCRVGHDWLTEHAHTPGKALELPQQSWVVATESAWSAMPKVFTIWNFTKNFVGSCCVQYFEITATTLIAGEYFSFYQWQKSQLLQIPL